MNQPTPSSEERALQRVLIVDDEAAMRTALESGFRRRGWLADTAQGVKQAQSSFRPHSHDLVVSDIRMPDGDGFEVMNFVHSCDPQAAVILLTAYGSIPESVIAIRGGAYDYLVKPVAFDQLEKAAQRVMQRIRPAKNARNCMLGHSPALLHAIERARQAAASNADILIQAESGTGKELLAQMIHRLSPRREQPFVAINCAAFPGDLLESELFGCVRGAFTGATSSRAGKFELADRGTLLLDEVGEMPASLQPKLLRVLQEREFYRLGDTRPVTVDIRVIATTNRRLDQMVREGSFRSDLYYRLNVIPLSLPPLRERVGDISLLAEHFLRIYAVGAVPGLSADFRARLESYSWPGNVRELANLMRRAGALCRGSEVDLELLEPCDLGSEGRDDGVPRLRVGATLEAMEKQLFEMTLQATGGNRSQAAEMLGVSLRTVRNKIRDYGLPPKESYSHV